MYWLNNYALNILDVENLDWYETKSSVAVIVSNCYSSTNDEHKKLKVSWKSLTTFLKLVLAVGN